jgi:hypothetical protein
VDHPHQAGFWLNYGNVNASNRMMLITLLSLLSYSFRHVSDSPVIEMAANPAPENENSTLR